MKNSTTRTVSRSHFVTTVLDGNTGTVLFILVNGYQVEIISFQMVIVETIIYKKRFGSL